MKPVGLGPRRVTFAPSGRSLTGYFFSISSAVSVVFGKSTSAKIAKEYDIPKTATLPLDPALSTTVDAGKIEYVGDEYLGELSKLLF